MPQYPYFHVDAFANAPLTGNQAAVMPMDAFPEDDQLLAIAAENNFAETAYVVRSGENSWDLRWFTPLLEVPLCGHATLAAAHVLFNQGVVAGDTINFDTRQSGRLSVTKLDDGRLEMDFPAHPPRRIDCPDGLVEALGVPPVEVWAGPYLLAVMQDASVVRNLTPNIGAIEPISGGATGGRGNLICAASGDGEYDVVSRFFAPGSGIPEDPATGSAHCIIAPLFSEKLGKSDLSCFQAYPGRGGFIDTAMREDRVLLRGRSITVVEGKFNL